MLIIGGQLHLKLIKPPAVDIISFHLDNYIDDYNGAVCLVAFKQKWRNA